jgi:adenylate kinase
MIREHNVEVKKTGQGAFWTERVTDNDETVRTSPFLMKRKFILYFS